MAHSRHGRPSHRWPYPAADGRVNFFHDRFEKEGARKQFAPLTLWCTAAGRLEWRYKAPPAPRPLLGLPELTAKTAPAVLTEGEKARDAAAILLPHHPVLTWQGGAQAVSKADFLPLAGCEVWLWADADEAGTKAMGAAADALAKIGARTVKRFDLEHFAALPGEENGTAVLQPGEPLQAGDDAADLVARGWTAAHLALILPAALLAIEPAKVGAGETATRPNETATAPAQGEGGRRFELTDKGVIYHEPDKTPRWVCAWLDVSARVRNPHGEGWGKLVHFSDPDRSPKRRIIPDALLSGDGIELERTLRDAGLHVSPTGRPLLRQYLIEAAPKARARITNRTGWHNAGPENAVYVLPDTAIGGGGEEWIFDAETGAANTFRARGTLDGWQAEVAALCAGNSRLLFAVSTAFAAPLLYLTGAEGGGFHFRSNSSDGKTTALRVAASCCGGTDFMQRWRATDNGLEALALQHCDAPLLLDELAQIDPRAAGEVAYMLANGGGKTRAGRMGGMRERANWRILFLSAGEIGLTEHMGEIGKTPRAGQELRLAEIPADAGAGLGLFEELHGYASGSEFAKVLAEGCRRNGGGAFVAYLAELARQQSAAADTVRQAIKLFESATLTDEAHGQARRVAGRFALVGAGGELATKFGITGWQPGVALRAARTCFEAWLSRRGGEGNQEADAMLAQVRRFLEAHGEARFVDWNRPATKDDHAPRVMNRCGYRRYDDVTGPNAGPHWYVFPEVFKSEICKGHDAGAVGRLLLSLGYIERGTEKDRPFTSRHDLPGEGRRRVYHVLPAIMGEGGDVD
jgi:uncharacterized protein (DUF927 family)